MKKQTQEEIQEEIYKDYLKEKQGRIWIGLFLLACILSCFICKRHQLLNDWNWLYAGKLFLIGMGSGYSFAITFVPLFLRVNVAETRCKLDRQIDRKKSMIVDLKRSVGSGPSYSKAELKILIRIKKIEQKMLQLKAEFKMIGGNWKTAEV